MIGLITVTVAVVMMVAIHFQRSSIMALVDDVTDQTLGRVELRVQRVLDQALILNHQTLRLIAAGTNAPNAKERIGDFFAKSLEVLESVSGAGLGFEETGEYIMAQRTPEGAIRIREYLRDAAGGRIIRTWRWSGSKREALGTETWDGYDPRERPFYRLARARGTNAWTDTYQFWTPPGETPSLGVSYATPWHDAHGKLLGVLVADFDLRAICHFLRDLERELPGYAVIVERQTNRNARLIAHPQPQHMLKSGANEPAANLDEASDPVVAAYIATLGKQPGTLGREGACERFQVGEGHYLGACRHLTDTADPPWTIAMVIPRAVILGTVRQNALWSLAGTACCLAAALAAVIWLARNIAQPLQNLSRQAQSIGRLDFDTVELRRSPIREVGQLENSMAEMKAGLRSFRKYIPADVVHQLIATGSEARLGGRQAELTLFFSDIIGFTALSEDLPPQRLVEHMGEYLSAISDVIHQNRGTVDKFIGDGVMAFWGAPQANPAHAADACRAAWQFQQRLRALGQQWQAAGRPQLSTRIGIHTGEVIVGNIGSDARMNYTVIGDAVNLASRMEGLNRHFGTEILISETTRAAAGAAIIARPVSRVVVKGKAQGVLVFELLGMAADPPSGSVARAERSAAAFAAFERRDFAQAGELYRTLLEDAPADTVARLQGQRCEELQRAPDPAAAEIVHRMTMK